MLPPEFLYPIDAGDEQPDLLAPVTHARRAGTEREFYLILRMRASTDANNVRERLATATRDLAQLKVPASPHASHGEERARSSFDRVSLDPIGRYLASNHRPAFRLTFAAASVLLLAGCLNIAALAAARNMDRQHDLRIGRALGASLWELGAWLVTFLRSQLYGVGSPQSRRVEHGGADDARRGTFRRSDSGLRATAANPVDVLRAE